MTIEIRVQEQYQLWMNDPAIDDHTKLELKNIAGEPKEIEDRFYRDLEFGTGGLRGVIGAGTNRINLYTVGRATQGLAQFINKSQKTSRSAVIAYDSRNQSPEFALEAAKVLAGNGIKAYLFESLRPTPELSFAVRALKADAGIVVTASHNPPEYNGYKVYGADGGQLVPDQAEQVIAEIQKVQSFSDVQRETRSQAESSGLLQWIGQDLDDSYTQAVTAVSLNSDIVKQMSDNFRIVFTPLHGAGNLSVRAVLQAIGFEQVSVVAEQELPDAKFSTVKSPNPEEKDAFALAIRLARQIDADIIIGTDPDCDRMGAVVKDASGEYFVLTGNQSGAIMVDYLLSSLKQRKALPQNGVVIKTIVTSEMGAAVAKHYGVETLNTLTGFKYIGEKMTQFEATKEAEFLFGYEESYGYLAGNYARDKDAVIASMLICEAAAYYKNQGKTLYEVLQELYERHGYFLEKLESRTLKGKDGVEQIQSIMEDWRSNPPVEINGQQVVKVEDFSQELYGLPVENVLKYTLADNSWFCLRPSGTEPKIKVYFAVCGASAQAADDAIHGLVNVVMSRVDQ
ncbi:phospho-sugar mutase [Paenibacillus radicis (ex Xue et al. 2023)]|uniref:Phosphoglucomutase n=1 Tax=Paenibacillus radicis (ex Xue et al. 2023) TaxID=2972489 RepID=A0ABT1YGM6_9BACL|nr:phospho-sugar mutase [Paenibacillus radicis (ex Xue et al. 2023)]MCR8632348.1 phospho-sugar mutase [Paenibacillus radicis (ex Xue et al. 2023)]